VLVPGVLGEGPVDEPPGAVRLVDVGAVLPPDLVKLLRAHIRRYGTTPDGRIFQTARGGIIQDSAYSAVLAAARKEALTEAQYRSPLGRRPYDLRHAAVSRCLNSGVPATEVARRAGHGLAVLLKVCAHCIDGQANAGQQADQ
jgi:integrase